MFSHRTAPARTLNSAHLQDIYDMCQYILNFSINNDIEIHKTTGSRCSPTPKQPELNPSAQR
jgi:hypothetical protein